MNIFKILVTTFLFGLVHNSFSQITDINGEYTPHSPEASSLGKYIDHPVDLSRGIPNISVPVYTLTEGDLSLPIGLSYHSQGVVVSSVSSWVGTGWTLKTGGVISRSVIGIQDDWQANGINLPEYGWYHMPIPMPNESLDGINHNPLGLVLDTINKLLNGKLDNAPDVFSYSLPSGYSGKFYFDHNKEIQFIDNHDNLKITVTTGNLGLFESFEVLDPQGIKYTFSEKEYTANEHTITSITEPFYGHSANAWYLTEIANVNETNKIFFSYEEENYQYLTKNSCQYITTNRRMGTPPGINATLEEQIAYSQLNDNCENNTPCNSDLKIYIKGRRLTKISCLVNDAEIDFNSIHREDISLFGSSNALDNIQVVYPSGKCTKFQFNYYNTIDNSNPGTTNITRFMLESFQKSTCDNSTIEPPYKFYYNDSIMWNGEVFFPKRNSQAIDHWGYYNGENHNASGVYPNFPTSEVYDRSHNLMTINTSNNIRESNQQKMLFGALNKIQHPLGAVDTFVFESNRVRDYEYWDSRELYKLNYNCYTADPISDYRVITYDELHNAKYDLKVSGAGCTSNSGQGGAGGYPNYPFQLEFLTPYPDYNTIRPAIVVTGGANQRLRYDLFELLGDYISPDDPVVFKLTSLSSSEINGEFRVYHHRKIASPQAVVGGLRIKNIKTTHDDVVSEKSYVYNELIPGSYYSSGKLVAYPTYVAGHVSDFSDIGAIHDILYKDQSHFALSNVEGRHICYENVRENFQDGSYQLHYFRPGEEARPISENSTFDIKYDKPQPDKGLLDSIKTYNSNGVLVLNKSFEYNIYIDSMFFDEFYPNNYTGPLYTYLPFQYRVVPCMNANAGVFFDLLSHYPYLEVSMYNPFMIYTKPTKTKTITYNELGQEPLVDISAITYDSYANLRTETKWREIDGNGVLDSEDFTRTTNYYNYNQGINYPLLSFMLDKNIVGVPYKTQTTQNLGDGWNNVISGLDIEYELNSGNLVVKRLEKPIHGIFYPVQEVLNWDFRGKPTQIKGYKLGTTWSTVALDDNYTRLFWVEDNLVRKDLHSDIGIQTTMYDYNADDKLNTITDHNNQIIEYGYDDLYRLNQISKGKAVGENDFREWSTLDYNYKLDALGNIISGANNEIISTQHFLPSNGITIPNQISKSIIDDLGRDYSLIKENYLPNGQDAIIKTDEFDPLGRLVSSTKLGEGTVSFNNESSAIGRILTAISPLGNTNYSYGHNTRSFVVDGKTYPAGTLNKQKIIDSDGSETTIYSDFLGREIRVVKPVTINGVIKNAITSKSYNEYNKLQKVIPPSGEPFIYEYNYRDLLISKKIPTESYEQKYYYDYFERQVAKSDANGNIIAVEYDDLGRIIATGEISALTYVYNHVQHMVSVPNGSISKVHSTITYKQSSSGNPMDWIESESVANMSTLNSGSPIYYGTEYTYDNIGRITSLEKDNHKGGKEIIRSYYNSADLIYKEETDHNVGNSSFGSEINSIYNYTFDNSLRLENTYFQVTGITGNQHVTNLVYNNKLQLVQKNIQETTANEYLQNIDFTYDNAGRLIKINELEDVNNEVCLADNYCDIHLNVKTETNGLNDQAEITSINYLDPILGEIAIPGITFPFLLNPSSKTTLINNIENWLVNDGYVFDEINIATDLTLIKLIQTNAPITNINQNNDISIAVISNCCGNQNTSDLFAENINFGSTGTTIKSTEWSTICNDYSKYGYKYDELKRLTKADYYSKQDISDSWSTTGGGGVYGIRASYDLLGNIINLRRNGSINGNVASIDNLAYEYNNGTGRLANIVESSGLNYTNHGQKGSTSYAYDDNGNVRIEQSKGISIDYNVFNLPIAITKTTSGDNIQNVYSANQNRLQKIVNQGSNQKIKDYIGSFEYITENGETKLESANFGFGRVTYNNGQGRIEYSIKDHLGTPRIHFTDRDNNDIITKADVIQENHNYPFGMKLEEMGGGTIGNENQYKYNEKELDSELGLDWYNYGARFYDPAVARWHSIDPLAENYDSWSTYNYVMGDPISNIDPDGRKVETIYENEKTGEKVEVKDGINKTVRVNDTDFETARVFATFINPTMQSNNDQSIASKELVESYTDFYNSVNYYNSFSLSTAYDYLFVQPNIPHDGVIEMVVPDLPIGRKKAAAKAVKAIKKPTGGWINKKIYQKFGVKIQTKFQNAMRKGIVAPKNQSGIIKLTATEMKEYGGKYTHKLKILGKGGQGDIRIYGYQQENGLYRFVKDKVGHKKKGN